MVDLHDDFTSSGVMSAAASTMDLSGLLGGIVETAIALADADFGNIQLLDSDGCLKIVAHRGFPDWWVEYWNTARPGQGVCGASLAVGERVVVEDVEKSPIFAGTAALDVQRNAGIRAVQSTPLRARSGQLLGMLSTHYRSSPWLDAKTFRVLDLLAAHAAAVIERERLLYAVAERESWYRAAVDSSGDGFLLLDGLGRILSVNQSYVARSGYSREELLTMRVPDVDSRETEAAIRRRQERIRQQGSDLFESYHAAKSGEIWPVEVIVYYRPEVGDRYFAFIRDLSKRKLLETQLRLSEERFRLAMEAAAEGIWDWNLETGEVYYSPGYATMLGFQPGELEANVKSWIGMLHPDDAESVVREVHRLLNGSGRYAIEFRLRAKDGSYRFILSRGKVIENDATGKPRRAIGTHMDLSEQKQAAQALVEAKDSLAEAQRIAHLGSFEYVAATRTIVWSEEEYRIYGLDPKEPPPGYEGMLARCIHPEDAESVRRTFNAAMESGTVYELEHRIVRPDGSVRWVYDLAHPQRDEQGKLQRFVGVTLDITSRKEQEEEAHKQHELMQTLVRQQVAMQTAAAFAHELNQPLVSVAAYSEVALRALRGGPDKAGQLNRALEGSHEQALRAGRVLHELIDHLHKGKIEPKPFDINHLVEEVVAKMRKVEFRNFQARLALEPGLPTVLGNRLQTEKVLLNLIQNGIEAIPAAGISPAAFEISVRTLAGHNMAHVTVRDNGPGIDTDTARRVFEPFFSTKTNGLGLGLAISRSLIETQGGQLWLDPEDGPGAVFHFTLPFAHD